VWFREPEWNIGVGEVKGLVPHVTGADFRKLYGIADGSPAHYALTYDDFAALAQTYGKMGGMDRVATVVKAIRAERPEALILDGGDTWQGSLTALRTNGGRHGPRDERARRRGDDLALGVHARHRPRHGDRRERAELPLPRRQHLRRRMGRARLRALPDVRAERRARSP
jgi:hypothetical protein